MKRYTRGQMIRLTAMFTGIDDPQERPESAVLHLEYQRGRTRERATVPMTASSGTFVSLWNSAVADSGIVHWCVQFSGPASRSEGSFELRANPANPGPSGSATINELGTPPS